MRVFLLVRPGQNLIKEWSMADHPPTSAAAPASGRRPRVRQRPRTPHEARQWRRRMAGYAIAAAAFILVVNALVGENGYLATMRAKHQRAELEEQLRVVREENQQLRDRIQRLRNDPAELEDKARRDLHLIKPGEKLIILKETPKPATPAEPGK
jgi:cell division protein FtsB